MNTININGLKFSYDRERNLFNGLLKINGITKKQFAEKFNLSYSYVNSFGAIIKGEEKPYPSWVLEYIKDILFFKIEFIRVYLSLNEIYKRLEDGKTLTAIYKDVKLKQTPSEEILLDELRAEEKIIYL